MNPTANTHTFDTKDATGLIPIDPAFKAIVKTLLFEAVERLNVGSCAIMLNGLKHDQLYYLVLNSHPNNLQPKASTDATPDSSNRPDALDKKTHHAAAEFIISTELPLVTTPERLRAHESISIPIDYDGHRIGYLITSICTAVYGATSSSDSQGVLMTGLTKVIDELCVLIKRYQIRHKLLNLYGDQQYWIGGSRALRELDQLIEKLAQTTMPIIIRGNKGTGKLLAARALHCHATQGFAPFIESPCEDWHPDTIEQTLAELWSYAKGGTLLIRNIDLLSSTSFSALSGFYATKKESSDASMQPIKFVLTLSQYHARELDNNNTLVNWLEFDCLELRLPNLQERHADIRLLCQHYINEYKLDVNFNFSDDAWQLLTEFSWPENVHQLQKLLQKLAIMVDSSCVRASMLLQIFPSMDEVSLNRKAFNLPHFSSPLASTTSGFDHTINTDYFRANAHRTN